MRRALCALVLALMPGLALATPPETSPRPMARLSQGGAVPGIVPVTLPMATPPGLTAAAPVIRAVPGARPAPLGPWGVSCCSRASSSRRFATVPGSTT